MVKEVHDLAIITAGIVNEKQKELSFKDLVMVQKISNQLMGEVTSFQESLVSLNKQKDNIKKEAEESIDKFKSEMLARVSEGGLVDPDYKDISNNFFKEAKIDAQNKVDKELSEKYSSLYEKEGVVMIEFEMGKEKFKVLLEKFEAYGQDMYKNMKAMVDIYEKLLEIDVAK